MIGNAFIGNAGRDSQLLRFGIGSMQEGYGRKIAVFYSVNAFRLDVRKSCACR